MRSERMQNSSKESDSPRPHLTGRLTQDLIGAVAEERPLGAGRPERLEESLHLGQADDRRAIAIPSGTGNTPSGPM